MRHKYLAKAQITIQDNPWTVFFQNSDQYVESMGKDSEDSRACTVTRLKCMHFNCSVMHPDDNVAVHELVHAYAEESFLHDLEKSPHQTEEFFCVMFEMRGDAILKQGQKLTRILRKHQRKLQAKQQPDEEENNE